MAFKELFNKILKKNGVKELEKQKSSVPYVNQNEIGKATIKKSKEEKFICVQCGKEHKNHIIFKNKKLSTRDFCSLKCFKDYGLMFGDYTFLKQENILNEKYVPYNKLIEKQRKGLYFLHSGKYKEAKKIFFELLDVETLKENKDIILHNISLADERMEYEKNHFCKRWINLSFTISKTYEKISKKQEVEKEAREFFNEFRKMFMSSKVVDIAERGGPVQIVYVSKKNLSKDFQEPDWTKDLLANPEVTHQNFKLKINKVSNKEYEFRILFEPYFLEEYLLDGRAIYKTNEILCAKYGIPFKIGQNRIAKINFDDNKSPIETSWEGMVEISYKIENRLNQSKFDKEFDKMMGEDISGMIKRMKKEKKEIKGIEKEWFKKVEKILQEDEKAK